MTAYRLCSRKYSPYDSRGARLHGGRWNLPGTPVLYTAATRSLAIIEIIVHYGFVPRDYQLAEFEIPDGVSVETIKVTELPPNWKADIPYTQNRGTSWAASDRTAVLRVPSAVISAEYNYILNPLHPASGQIQFRISPEPFDNRLHAPEP